MSATAVRWQQAGTTLSRNLPDGILLLSAVRDDEPIAVTGPGGQIWAALDAPRTLDEVVAELAEIYDVPADTIRHDVVVLLDDLLERGLVEQHEPG